MTKSSAYLGHLDEETGREQLLCDHLTGVADLAGRFAAAFGEEAMGRLLGLYHDIGKYSREFQAYLRAGEEEKKRRRGRIDHSTAGTQEVVKLRQSADDEQSRRLGRGMTQVMAFCIAGHHGGIPNRGTTANTAEEGTLLGRLKRQNLPDYRAYHEADLPQTLPPPSLLLAQVVRAPLSAMLYTRMLFSCLVAMRTFSTRKTSCRRGMSSGKVLLLWKPCSNVCRRALKRNFRNRRRKKKSKNGSCRSMKSASRFSPRASPQEKRHEGIYTG